MIAYLKGKIINKGKGYLILSVNNVGYKVFVNEKLYAELSIGQEAEFYIYQHVREDALILFGFFRLNHLEMFELLLSISGVGPKSALAVLGVANISDITDSIRRGDHSLLVKVSGIGKKTAERMVLELRDKITGLDADGSGNKTGAAGKTSGSEEEIDALMALGYSLSQAREALREVDPSLKESGQRIKAALQKIR